MRLLHYLGRCCFYPDGKLYAKYQCVTVIIEVAFIDEVYRYGVIEEGHEWMISIDAINYTRKVQSE